MHILSAIIVALCFINIAAASGEGVNCLCSCCVPFKRAACQPTDVGFVRLDLNTCNDNKCVAACQQEYPFCESSKAVMQATCKAV